MMLMTIRKKEVTTRSQFHYPGSLNSFKIRKEVGRSKLHAYLSSKHKD